MTFVVFVSSNEVERSQRDTEGQCGVPSQSTSLVVGGDDFPRGSWPWMVAIMQRNVTPPTLLCGGVLISESKVLTGEFQQNS